MSKVLYMANVTEFEYEGGWGASQRPDGVAFCADKTNLENYFSVKKKDSIQNSSANYQLFEEITTPKLVKVNDECYQFYTYKTKDSKEGVLWLRGDSLKLFLEGVDL